MTRYIASTILNHTTMPFFAPLTLFLFWYLRDRIFCVYSISVEGGGSAHVIFINLSGAWNFWKERFYIWFPCILELGTGWLLRCGAHPPCWALEIHYSQLYRRRPACGPVCNWIVEVNENRCNMESLFVFSEHAYCWQTWILSRESLAHVKYFWARSFFSRIYAKSYPLCVICLR